MTIVSCTEILRRRIWDIWSHVYVTKVSYVYLQPDWNWLSCRGFVARLMQT
ncbi:hypothetical protein ACVWZ4_001305 [Bradyrhizobium sp. USDA 4472]